MSDSSSSRYSGSSFASTYPINGSVMTIAVTTLFLVVFFILALHIYAKWFWQRSFAGDEDGNGNPRNRRQPRQAAAVGIDKTTLDLLPTFTYSQSTASKLRLSSECAVCLSEFQDDDTGRLLPSCNHGFHTDCIDMWFFSHTTCPLCRTEVKPLTEEVAADSQPQESAQPLEGGESGGEGMPESSNIDLTASTDGSSHGNSHVITIEGGMGGEGGEQQADMAGAGSGTNGGNQSAAEMAGRYEGLRSSIKRILSRQSSRVLSSEPGADIPKDSTPPPPPV